MKLKSLILLLPAALLLSACSSDPIIKTSERQGDCAWGSPERVASKFIRLVRSQEVKGVPTQADLAKFQPVISNDLYNQLLAVSMKEKRTEHSGDIFTSNMMGPRGFSVMSVPSVPNSDVKHIPLRVTMKNNRDGSPVKKWQDEISMIREGSCWVVDDVRFMGAPTHIKAATTRQALKSL